MTKQTILIAGATGNLGNLITQHLIKRNVQVKAIVRSSTDVDKVNALKKIGVSVLKVDLTNVNEIAEACQQVDCVVSAVAGLKDVIVDFQKRLLGAAVKAGVTRFIPSDFCTDYNDLNPGDNRNFDLRREFKTYLDSMPIKASSVFNGAFADILKYNTPALNLKTKSIGYWGDKADWNLDFTTMNDTAAFTAEVALDEQAPRNLQIASFQVSPNMLRSDVKTITGMDFRLEQMGTLDDFAKTIKHQRAENPAGENELYAKWQQAQYMYCMFTTHHNELSNTRYPNLTWTPGEEYLRSFMSA